MKLMNRIAIASIYLKFLTNNEAKRWNKWNQGALFTKRQDLLPPDLVKSRCGDIVFYKSRVALKLYRRLGGIVS